MYSCKILKDSINICGDRLTTMEVTFPRIVLSEFNTHRVFSRNSASSRAIPIEKIIKRIVDDPFVPEYWGKNQSGMSAFSVIEEVDEAKKLWIETRDLMIGQVRKFLALGVHKQLVNRLLEPWCFQTCIVSSTTWDNFFNLRCDKNAQPEIRTIAEMMRDEYNSNVPELLVDGEWHLPLMDDIEELRNNFNEEELRKICVGRLCRVSYLTHNGVRDPNEDIKLCNNLMNNGHMSPFEHCAVSLGEPIQHGNFVGFKQYRKYICNEDIFLGNSIV